MSPNFSAMVSPQSIVSPSHAKLSQLGYPQPQMQNVAELFISFPEEKDA